MNGVGIGFNFFEFIYRRWSDEERIAFHKKLPTSISFPTL